MTSTSTGQLVLVPSPASDSFQLGHLGVDHEQAALEGQVHLKGIDPATIQSCHVRLQTIESGPDGDVELAASESTFNDVSTSSISFSLPLAADTPQALSTPFSWLSHTLTASLSGNTSLTTSIPVFPVRYSPHYLVLPTEPQTASSPVPTPVSIQIPRHDYVAGERLPVYVTIPSPARSLVVDQGLRVRNIRVEIVRTIRILTFGARQPGRKDTAPGPSSSSSTAPTKAPLPPDVDEDDDTAAPNSVDRTVVARSGAPCRFHTSRPVQLRFLLRIPPTPHPTTATADSSSSSSSDGGFTSDFATITQTTIKHSVSFALKVHFAFLTTAVPGGPRTEAIQTVSLPLNVLPPIAPPPADVYSLEDLDAAYAKKHDAPPSATNRREDAEGEPGPPVDQAGPSGANVAPPPFDDAPPSFAEASGSALQVRLPSFHEAEADNILSSHASGLGSPSDDPPANVGNYIFPGEGLAFGFLPSEQFDGIGAPDSDTFADLAERPPPPTITAAMQDTALDPITGEQAVTEPVDETGQLLPPPPPMDDPSDPPPGIDDARFHTRDPLVPPGLNETEIPPPIHEAYAIPPPEQPDTQPGYAAPPADTTDAPQAYSSLPPPAHNQTPATDGSHAPPPYLGSQDAEADHGPSVPPPYVG